VSGDGNVEALLCLRAFEQACLEGLAKVGLPGVRLGLARVLRERSLLPTHVVTAARHADGGARCSGVREQLRNRVFERIEEWRDGGIEHRICRCARDLVGDLLAAD
jgi:hypothetical protein